eukprot:1695428-Rhodomonas_salina.5
MLYPRGEHTSIRNASTNRGLRYAMSVPIEGCYMLCQYRQRAAGDEGKAAYAMSVPDIAYRARRTIGIHHALSAKDDRPRLLQYRTKHSERRMIDMGYGDEPRCARGLSPGSAIRYVSMLSRYLRSLCQHAITVSQYAMSVCYYGISVCYASTLSQYHTERGLARALAQYAISYAISVSYLSTLCQYAMPVPHRYGAHTIRYLRTLPKYRTSQRSIRKLSTDRGLAPYAIAVPQIAQCYAPFQYRTARSTTALHKG